MFNIIICDDEEFTCTAVENVVLEYARIHSIKVETDIFYSGEALCKYMERNNTIDVLFLDIELGQLGGVDVGKIIRDQLKNDVTQIVYISSKENYAMKLFKIRPLDFLIKPLQKKEIDGVLDKAISLIQMKNHFFEYSFQKTYNKILIQDIYYFKSEGKKIQIITKDPNKVKEFYGKINQLQEQLSEKQFLLIHKSFFVQYDYISEYKYDSVKMINGDVLSISQANRSDVRMKLMERRKGRN